MKCLSNEIYIVPNEQFNNFTALMIFLFLDVLSNCFFATMIKLTKGNLIKTFIKSLKKGKKKETSPPSARLATMTAMQQKIYKTKISRNTLETFHNPS